MKKIIVTLTIVLLTISAFSQSRLSLDEKYHWNGFVDYVASKGLKGSPLLSKDITISQNLFAEYNKISNKDYNYNSFVIAVQTEMKLYKDNAISEMKAGKGSCDCNINTEFMVGLSIVDGWCGAQTTTYKFPTKTMNTFNSTGKLIASVNQGIYQF